MSGHTPGPWKLQLGKGLQFDYIINTKKDQPVACFAHYKQFTKKETKANARLISAAPDLLAVVKELEESASYWSEYDVPLGIVDRLRAAIARAEPKGNTP